MCVAGIIFVGYHLYVDVIKPNRLYNEALKNKKYSQAITYGKYLDDNKKIYDNETKKLLGEKSFYLH